MLNRCNTNPQNKQVMSGRELSPLVRWWRKNPEGKGYRRPPNYRLPSNAEILQGAA